MGARESIVAIIDFASCGHCIFFNHFTRIFLVMELYVARPQSD